MPGTLGPNLGITWGYSIGENGWGVGGYNPGFAKLDTIVHLSVISVLNTPPGAPVNGDRYIVGATPTGAFVGHTDEIAVYLTIGTPGWVFYTPKLSWRAWNAAVNGWLMFNGTAWFADKYALGFSAPQTTAYTASQVIGHHRFSRAVEIPANFGAHLGDTSQAGGSAVTTASTVFSVERAASATPNTFAQVGTITFAIGTVTPTFASSGGTPISFAAGDVLRIVAPASPDATFAGFYATLVGHES